MTQRELTFTVDPSVLFDTIHALKGNTEPLGTRLVEMMLADAGFIDRLGLAMYGITVADGPVQDEDWLKKTVETAAGGYVNKDEVMMRAARAVHAGMMARLAASQYLKDRYFGEMRVMLKAHDVRVTELLRANNVEVERRRAAERLAGESEGWLVGTLSRARSERGDEDPGVLELEAHVKAVRALL